MKMRISLSMPQLSYVRTFEQELDDPPVNRSCTEKIIKGRPKHILGCMFYACKSNSKKSNVVKDSLFLVENDLTVFWSMTYVAHNTTIDKQVLVCDAAWQSRSNAKLVWLMRRLYLEHYLPIWNILESGDIQKPLGKKMWLKLVDSSLSKYKVYVLTVDGKFLQIHSMHEFAALKAKIWGTSRQYRAARIFIAKADIKKISDMPHLSQVVSSMVFDDDCYMDIEHYENAN